MLFRSMCYQAWSDFRKHFFAVVFLTACFIGINVLSLEIGNYLELLDAWQASLPFAIPSFIIVHGFRFLQASLAAIGYVFFMQHVLDIVYARQITWFYLSTATLHAVMFDTMVYYITSHKGMPLYFPFDSILVLESTLRDAIEELSQRADALLFFSVALGFIVVSSILYLLYLLAFRCFFINLFMLEKKYSIKQAFNKSWNLALGHAGLYATCWLAPHFMIFIMFFVTAYFAGMHEYVMSSAQIVAWLIFAWGLLLRAHLFKTLRAQQAIE